MINSSFEQAGEDSPLPAGWGGDRDVYSRDATGGRDGSGALKFVNNDPARYRLANQRIPLRPGRAYQFSGWIKTDGITGEESGATFCIEWTDKEGKWLGGAYPSGVTETAEWTQIVGTARVPDDAGSCTLSCYVRKGMVGTAWFDDVEVVRVVEPPLKSVLTSPVYRGQITGAGPKTVRAVASLDLRDFDFRPGEIRVRAVLSSTADGKVCWEGERRPRAQGRTVDPITFEMPADGLTPGAYQLEVALVGADGKTIHSVRHNLTRLPEDFQPKSRIDEHRRLMVEGRPFFPLGMYWSSINEEDLRVYADSEFNCLMPYGSPSREQMDMAGKHGLKVIYSIKDWYAGSRWSPPSIKTVEDEEPRVRARVREFRDHPALLAWYLNDELPQRFLPQLEAHQRWAVEEDPHHPTWVVLYQVNEVSAYLNTFDVIGTDPYPIGRKPASMAAQWTAETFRQVQHARPMWQVPQLHNWANYAKTEEERSRGRTPTYEEIRSMAWQCIAEGATGLVFYSWFDVKRNPDVGFDEQWAGLKRLAAEIDRLAPVILSIEPPAPITVNDGRPPAWLHCLVRRHQGKHYLIAVNDGDGEGRVTLELPFASRTIRELTSGRIISRRDGSFTAELDRLAVHLYEIEGAGDADRE